MDRRGKVVRRTSIEISGIDAGNTPDAEVNLDGRHVARECYKCLHIDVENPDGSPGEFLSFPPYSAPGGLREILFPSEAVTSPDMDHLEESSSSLQVLESATDYLMKKVRRLGVIAGASVLRFGDLSVYEEAHFATGHDLNDCADLTHLGGCGCFEEQKRLHQLRLEALELTTDKGNRADSNSDSDSTATASARQILEPER